MKDYEKLSFEQKRIIEFKGRAAASMREIEKEIEENIKSPEKLSAARLVRLFEKHAKIMMTLLYMTEKETLASGNKRSVKLDD